MIFHADSANADTPGRCDAEHDRKATQMVYTMCMQVDASNEPSRLRSCHRSDSDFQVIPKPAHHFPKAVTAVERGIERYKPFAMNLTCY